MNLRMLSQAVKLNTDEELYMFFNSYAVRPYGYFWSISVFVTLCGSSIILIKDCVNLNLGS